MGKSVLLRLLGEWRCVLWFIMMPVVVLAQVQYLEKGRDSLFPWTDMLAQRPVAFPHPDRPKVFVLTFEGDLLASQVKKLRREVTAVLQGADPTRGDQVVVLLNSGGGTVNGYGLGAAQLQRIKVIIMSQQRREPSDYIYEIMCMCGRRAVCR